MTETALSMTADRRSARRDQNRQAALDAYLLLLPSNLDGPTFDQVAESSGLSARSLYRYFNDLDTLRHEAMDRALERLEPHLPVRLEATPDASLLERVETFVEERERLLNINAEIAAAMMFRAAVEQRIADVVAAIHATFRQRAAMYFAPELAEFTAEVGAARLTTIDLAAQYPARYYIIRDLGHSNDEYRRYLTWLVFAALTANVSLPDVDGVSGT